MILLASNPHYDTITAGRLLRIVTTFKATVSCIWIIIDFFKCIVPICFRRMIPSLLMELVVLQLPLQSLTLILSLTADAAQPSLELHPAWLESALTHLILVPLIALPPLILM